MATNVAMTSTSLPHEAESAIRVRTSVPLPLVSTGRQRHRLLRSSRTRTSGPPTASTWGSAIRTPDTRSPDVATALALLSARSIRQTVLPAESRTYGAPSGAADQRVELDGLVGGELVDGVGADVDDAVQAVEAGRDLLAQLLHVGRGVAGRLGLVELGVRDAEQLEGAALVVADQVDAVADHLVDGRLGLAEGRLGHGQRGERLGGRLLAGDGVDAEGEAAGDRDERQQRDGGPALRLEAAGRRR